MDNVLISKVTEYEYDSDGEYEISFHEDKDDIQQLMLRAEEGISDAVEILTQKGYMSPTRGCHVNRAHDRFRATADFNLPDLRCNL